MRRIHTSSGSAAIKIVAFCAVIAGIYLAQSVLLPVAVAILLAFALNPIVRWLSRPLRSRGLAIGVTIVMTALFSAGLVALTVAQARQFMDQSAGYRSAITERLKSTRAGALALSRLLRDVRQAAELPDPDHPEASKQDGQGTRGAKVEHPPPTVLAEPTPTLFDVAGRALRWWATLVFTVLLVAAVLLHQEDLRDRLVRILGVDSLPLTRRTLEDASVRVSRFLLAQAGMNGAGGVMVALGLFLVGVPNAALLGIMAALLRFIPYLGMFAAAALAFLTAMATSQDWTAPLLVLGIFLVVELVISLALEPWLYGKRAGLSLFGVVVAISFWGWLWGIPGLLVAVPLTVCVVLLARHFPALEPLSVLLGDAPPLTAADRFHHRLLTQDVEGAREALAQAAAEPDAAPGAVEQFWFTSLRRAAADAGDGRLPDSDAETYARAAHELLGSAPASSGPNAVMLFPSSNPLDILAGAIIRSAIGPSVPARVIEPPVILSELIDDLRSARAVVVPLVARASRRRARLLARALRARVPGVRVIVAQLGPQRPAASAGTSRGVRYVGSVPQLFEALDLPQTVRTPVPPEAAQDAA